jgi:hypothetical protein
MTTEEILALRQQLRAAGYSPIPLYGKEPPIYGKNNKRKGLSGWEKLDSVSDAELVMWQKTWPDAINTGALTRLMPTLDADILNEEAARAIENYIRERYEDCGYFLVRIGKPPKRAFLFRVNAEEVFDKISVNLTAANGSTGEKLEFLADGQQLVVDGIHPETKQPYRWFGGELGKVRREELPYIREQEARELVDALVEMLIREHGYQRASERPRKGNGGTSGAPDWQYLLDNIREGRELHDSLRDLAAKLIASGMSSGAATNHLRALMEGSNAPHDERWQERYDDIPRLVDGAVKLKSGPAIVTGPPSTIDQTLAVFRKWLLLRDPVPIYAALGTVAANLLPGDPVWLGLIGPPSSAKTEILNAFLGLPYVVQCATLTPAGLLSGSPKKQRAAGARGGLLLQIGSFGIVLCKDFGSVLSMHSEMKAEVLAALREVYDGAWTRHLGTDGGRTLTWKGKVGLLFAATGVIDSHHGVIGSMGDRFLFNRIMPPDRGQFNHALVHVGVATGQMRKELAEAVIRLFSAPRPDPKPMSDKERDWLDRIILLVVRLRGSLARDRQTKDIENVYGVEGVARLGLTLERLLAGLDTLDVPRKAALRVIRTVALDSVPPNRRAAYEHLVAFKGYSAETRAIAEALALPTNTIRRVLEELAVYGLIERRPQEKGKADQWAALDWESALQQPPKDWAAWTR